MSNLSDEEKKAIKELTEIKELVEEDLKNEKYEVTATMDRIDLKSLVVVLNLIEKQQKEIEVLKEDLDKKVKALDIAMSNPDYICKDKIRENIKHYNNELEHIKNGEEFENEKPMYYWGKVALEDLLEEN